MFTAKMNTFRIISFTLAGADVLQTIPGTFTLYKKQWTNRNLSPLCVFYALARYLTIISLVTNGIGFYATDYTLATCRPFYMTPNVTAMLAGMAIQVLVFIRTYAISGRSNRVYYGLGALMLLGFPVQAFGIIYHREMGYELRLVIHLCDSNTIIPHSGSVRKVLVKGEPDWNIVYYSAHMTFDLIACATATFYLVYSSRIQGTFTASKFVKRVLRNGLIYTIIVFLANLWVVLEFKAVLKTGVGATLPLAVMLIAVQHLILSTQRPTSDGPSTTEDSRSAARSGRRPANAMPPRSPRAFGNESRQDMELRSGVYVVTETFSNSNSDRKAPEFGDPKPFLAV
ncbi:hypothetical protein B0H15DRAFT_947297 [Mycena belliarum]|uniref:Uncharacterized protein n=1 Tax=Mycena belliarum TaxID=1033014 RepID=A0AAD6U9A2_9AGAR|nr:hypothetical protein B0H15DRAFT_947297 [Mycena belliae]